MMGPNKKRGNAARQMFVLFKEKRQGQPIRLHFFDYFF